MGCPIPREGDGKLGCCALIGCTDNPGGQLALAPTVVELEDRILLFFAGFFNCCAMLLQYQFGVAERLPAGE